jgi:hypothetical protein
MFDVPLSKDPRTEPPTDVAASEALLRIVPGESIVSVRAIVFCTISLEKN